ncbi:MAG: hypothetical protein ACAH59_04020 [Pseudobdellovibrionaceae bacterium]
MIRSGLLLSLLFFTVSLAEAQPGLLCRQIHQKSATPSDFILDPQKLEKEGFRITKEGSLFDTRQNIILGYVSKRDFPYLYEWADLEFQKLWVQNGGLSKEDMDQYIRDEAQAYGRGYYVSTHPTDSIDYGNAVTVFKPAGTMTVLGFTSILNSLGTVFFQRLQRVGVDAIQGTNTWFSIINDKHLKVAQGEIQDPQLAAVQSPKAIGRFLISGLITQLPKDHPLRQMTAQLTEEGVQKALNHDDPSEIQKLTQFEDWIQRPEIQKYFNPTLGFSLHSIFSYFDIVTTLQVLKKGPAEVKDLKAISDSTRKLVSNRKKINLNKVKDFRDFAQLADIYTGQKTSLRGRALKVSTQGIADLPGHFYELFLQLQRNQLVSMNRNGSPGRVQIELLNLQKIYQFYIGFLSPGLRQRLEQLAQQQDLSHSDLYRLKEAQVLLQESLAEITNLLFTGTPEQLRSFLTRAFSLNINVEDINPYLLYRAFMSIQPFANDNGPMGQLYFEWLQRKSKNSNSVIELADFNIFLFMNSAELEKLHMATRIFNAWISRAKNQAELLDRLEKAKAQLSQQFPSLRDYWKVQGD